MKFEDTLFVSDLDGTLLGDAPRIPDEAAELLRALIAEGLPFTVATARSWASTAPIIEGLGLRLPAVIYNGAHIVDPQTGKLLHSCTLPPQQAESIWRLFRNAGVCVRVESMLEGRCRVSWLESMEDEGLRLYLGPRKGDTRFRPVEDEDRLLDGQPFQFAAMGRKAALQPVFEQLQTMGGLYAALIADSYDPDWHWLTCCRADATKASGVDHLRQLTGRKHIVCFGDNYNDLPMFSVADEAYAVANAAPEVRAAATGVIGSNLELGVPQYLRRRAGAWPCPCCGFLTLPAPRERATAYICPVCFWENDAFISGDDEPSDENHGMTLKEARENYRAFGACAKELREHVRKPAPEEFPV